MPKKLGHAKVMRSGVTARTWNYETNTARYEADEDSVSFSFDIASKGGGRTDILLTVGVEDLPAILEDLAHQSPDFQTVLVDALSTAIHEGPKPL